MRGPGGLEGQAHTCAYVHGADRNADCHAKNLALLFEDDNTVDLAPLYDTVPTALWPALRKGSARRVNDIVDFHRMTTTDIVAEATRWRHSPARLVAVRRTR